MKKKESQKIETFRIRVDAFLTKKELNMVHDLKKQGFNIAYIIRKGLVAEKQRRINQQRVVQYSEGLDAYCIMRKQDGKMRPTKFVLFSGKNENSVKIHIVSIKRLLDKYEITFMYNEEVYKSKKIEKRIGIELLTHFGLKTNFYNGLSFPNK